MSSVTYAVLADVNLNDSEDIYCEPCWNDHTYAELDSYGREMWLNAPCTCDVVQVGLVMVVRPFAVHTTSSNLDDLPF
jgi:hypothetical protein